MRTAGPTDMRTSRQTGMRRTNGLAPHHELAAVTTGLQHCQAVMSPITLNTELTTRPPCCLPHSATVKPPHYCWTCCHRSRPSSDTQSVVSHHLIYSYYYTILPFLYPHLSPPLVLVILLTVFLHCTL